MQEMPLDAHTNRNTTGYFWPKRALFSPHLRKCSEWGSRSPLSLSTRHALRKNTPKRSVIRNSPETCPPQWWDGQSIIVKHGQYLVRKNERLCENEGLFTARDSTRYLTCLSRRSSSPSYQNCFPLYQMGNGGK